MEIDPTFVERVKKVEWFTNCRRPGPFPCTFDLHRAASWEEVDTAYDPNWEEIIVRKTGDLTESLCIHYRDMYQSWNDLLLRSRAALATPVQDQVLNYWTVNELDTFFGTSTAFHVVKACIEAAYLRAGCRIERFFLELFTVYEAGHLPCGWTGTFPDGRLVYF